MVNEHDRVVLTTSAPGEDLEAGDVGTIAHAYHDGAAYAVEFLPLDGQTAAVVALEADHVRQLSEWELTHARRIATGS